MLSKTGEFERILIHEIFHFTWVRLSNANRRSWECLLQKELRDRASGELGWSAEWRKRTLTHSDTTKRSPKWRRYACESFCDSAAWLFGELGVHDEFTLAAGRRHARRAWFRATFPAASAVPI